MMITTIMIIIIMAVPQDGTVVWIRKENLIRVCRRAEYCGEHKYSEVRRLASKTALSASPKPAFGKELRGENP